MLWWWCVTSIYLSTANSKPENLRHVSSFYDNIGFIGIPSNNLTTDQTQTKEVKLIVSYSLPITWSVTYSTLDHLNRYLKCTLDHFNRYLKYSYLDHLNRFLFILLRKSKTRDQTNEDQIIALYWEPWTIFR